MGQRRRLRRHPKAAEIAERYRAGATIAEVSDAVGVGMTTVRAVLADEGVQMRQRGPARGRPPRVARQTATAEVVRQMAQRHAAGCTFVEIGAEFGFYPSTVEELLEEAARKRRRTSR